MAQNIGHWNCWNRSKKNLKMFIMELPAICCQCYLCEKKYKQQWQVYFITLKISETDKSQIIWSKTKLVKSQSVREPKFHCIKTRINLVKLLAFTSLLELQLMHCYCYFRMSKTAIKKGQNITGLHWCSNLSDTSSNASYKATLHNYW